MKFEISFPDQPADEAGVLAQELRLALLRSGADPSKVELKKDRADAMDLGSVVQIALDAYHASGPIAGSVIQTALDAYHASRPIVENVIPGLVLAHFAQLVFEICAPAHSGILLKTPRRTYKLSASETTVERLKQIFATLDSDEHGN